MKNLRVFILCAGALLLSSCQTAYDTAQSFDASALPTAGGDTSVERLASNGCPPVEIVPELGTIIEFDEREKPSLDGMTSRLDMTNSNTTCKFRGNTMTVDLRLGFQGKLGPKVPQAGQPFFSYPFFVAIVSPGGSIVAKEIFGASITYEGGEQTKAYQENLRHIIPVKSRSHGAGHKIMVGFQLTPEQLSFNRYLIKTYGQNSGQSAQPANAPTPGVKPQ